MRPYANARISELGSRKQRALDDENVFAFERVFHLWVPAIFDGSRYACCPNATAGGGQMPGTLSRLSAIRWQLAPTRSLHCSVSVYRIIRLTTALNPARGAGWAVC